MGIFSKLGKTRREKKVERIIPDVLRERIASGKGIGEDDGQVQLPGRKSAEISQKITAKDRVSTAEKSRDSALQRDPGKRQRIFIVAAAVVLLVFGLKVWKQEDWEIHQVIAVAGLASVMTYIGLMWAFRFDISRKGYLAVLPQPAMFVFGYVLFVEMFFFQQFERIYEALMFGGLLIVFLMVLGIVFLTANILNVSTFRPIPLLQVAQTSSYAITLFNVFFVPLFIASLGWHIVLTAALLVCVYFAAVVLHLLHFSLNSRTVLRASLGIGWVAASAAGVLLLWPVPALFRILLPAIIVYVCVGIVMHDVRKALRPLLHWEYAILLIVVVIVLLSRATWGIGGHAWM